MVYCSKEKREVIMHCGRCLGLHSTDSALRNAMNIQKHAKKTLGKH